jgi:hypothetical protein
MFKSWFNKPKFDEPDESNASEEESLDEQPNIFTKPLCVQQWRDNIMVSYYFLSIRDVAPYLSTWCFNRKMDEQHKEKIKQDLLAQSNPHLMGTIQVIRDKHFNCRVLNGQHRLCLLQEIIKDDINFEFQMNLMFEVYDCDIDNLDDVTEITTIEDIFKIANNSLNMKPEQDHDILCKQIVMAMMADPILKRGIVDKTNGSVHKPKITAKLLFELFKALLPSDKINVPLSEIIIRIKKINTNISITPYIKLFGRYTPAQHKLKQFEKAKDIDFYLNLESRMNPDIWIETLADPI